MRTTLLFAALLSACGPDMIATVTLPGSPAPSEPVPPPAEEPQPMPEPAPFDWYAGANPCVTGCATKVRHVALGAEHTCAQTYDGQVRCWGSNTFGQSGDADGGTLALPQIVQLGAGDRHTCALSRGGEVWCWGANDVAGSSGRGQLGLPKNMPAKLATPTRVPLLEGDPVRGLFVGEEKTIVVRDNAMRDTVAFGAIAYGDFDGVIDVAFALPRTKNPALAVDEAGYVWVANMGAGVRRLGTGRARKLVAVAGGSFELGRDGLLRSGAAENFYPCVSNANRLILPRPGAPTCEATAVPIAARDVSVWGRAPDRVGAFACLVRDDGRVACWGQNAQGQLGQGWVDTASSQDAARGLLPEPRAEPLLVEGPVDAVEVVAGPTHACAVTRGGELWCWGVNGPEDRLGTGARSGSLPQRVALR